MTEIEKVILDCIENSNGIKELELLCQVLKTFAENNKKIPDENDFFNAINSLKDKKMIKYFDYIDYNKYSKRSKTKTIYFSNETKFVYSIENIEKNV
ncbi:MAG: hypothetical protein IKP65_03330 [Alphaproteobacteria bacterium]|nr:hypothetical protein [Alphaproteobacteria bacterium]